MRRSLYPQVAVLLFVALFLAIRTAEGQCATVLWSTFGTSGGTGFGSAVASVGDINADGVPDFVVGAPSAASGSSSSLPGQARVFSGTDGSPLQVYSGANSGDRFGAAVAGAGDFNGDGTGDVLVGAPAGSSFPSGPGHAYVFSGSNGSTLLTLSGPPGFGDAVASAGDLNSDGLAEVIIGSPTAGTAIVAGSPGGPPLLTLTGIPPGTGSFGKSVAGLGDVTGDSVPDILVGAPDASPLGLYGAGQAYVFSGASGSIVFPFPLSGSGPNQLFGRGVAGVGDLDGDAKPDILVGASGTGPSANQGGYAKVFSGATGAILLTAGPASPFDRFAEVVAGPGDVDGDGIGDFVVGAPTNSVFGGGYPQLPGYVSVFSGATGVLLGQGLGASGGEGFGTSVAGAGDLNGDGRNDVIAGGPYGVGMVLQAGIARVFSAGSGAATTFGVACGGSGGYSPTITSTGGSACIGNSGFGIGLTNALGGSLGVLIIGWSTTTWNSSPLPLSLGSVGMPGCFLNVSPDVLFSSPTGGSGAGAGATTVLIPVPWNPALVSGQIFFQWYVVDPGPSLVQGAFSEGLAVVLN